MIYTIKVEMFQVILTQANANGVLKNMFAKESAQLVNQQAIL